MPKAEPERERTAGKGEEQTLHSGRVWAEATGRQGAQRAIDAIDVYVHQIVKGIAGAVDQGGRKSGEHKGRPSRGMVCGQSTNADRESGNQAVERPGQEEKGTELRQGSSFVGE